MQLSIVHTMPDQEERHKIQAEQICPALDRSGHDDSHCLLNQIADNLDKSPDRPLFRTKSL